ncbi:MAG: TRAM domain-containing protein [Candidatus Micrarchaeota archaeon]
MDIQKPVKVGDELDVTIEAVASKGDGIAKKDGFVIFVPGAKSGETIKVRITNVKRTCAEAEVAGAEAPAASSEAEVPVPSAEEPAGDSA